MIVYNTLIDDPRMNLFRDLGDIERTSSGLF